MSALICNTATYFKLGQLDFNYGNLILQVSNSIIGLLLLVYSCLPYQNWFFTFLLLCT